MFVVPFSGSPCEMELPRFQASEFARYYSTRHDPDYSLRRWGQPKSGYIEPLVTIEDPHYGICSDLPSFFLKQSQPKYDFNPSVPLDQETRSVLSTVVQMTHHWSTDSVQKPYDYANTINGIGWDMTPDFILEGMPAPNEVPSFGNTKEARSHRLLRDVLPKIIEHEKNQTIDYLCLLAEAVRYKRLNNDIAIGAYNPENEISNISAIRVAPLLGFAVLQRDNGSNKFLWPDTYKVACVVQNGSGKAGLMPRALTAEDSLYRWSDIRQNIGGNQQATTVTLVRK